MDQEQCLQTICKWLVLSDAVSGCKQDGESEVADLAVVVTLCTIVTMPSV